MNALTQTQALALLNALEAENNAARAPCPDLASWVADCRASPSTLAWEASRWPVSDDNRWSSASLYEYANGQIAVAVWGDDVPGCAGWGVVILADDLFYPVTGDPSADWSFAMGDDHPGFATLGEALMPVFGADEPGAVVAAIGPNLVVYDCTNTAQNDGSGLMFAVEVTGSANPDDDGMIAEYDTLAAALRAHPSLVSLKA